MGRLLMATTLVLAQPVLAAGMPISEGSYIATVEARIHFGSVFPTEILWMPDVTAVPPVAVSGNDRLPLPRGEGGGPLGAGSSAGGNSSGGASGSSTGSGGSGGVGPVAIPAPSALFLVGSGLLGIIGLRRLQKR